MRAFGEDLGLDLVLVGGLRGLLARDAPRAFGFALSGMCTAVYSEL
jgi:hypothetical protein